MVSKVMDDLLYLGLGALAAEVADMALEKYADPKANLNIAMLKSAGKPSVYVPGATGVAALGYAIYQGDKFGRLKDEEMVIAGYGVYALIKTAGKILVPETATTVGSSGVRIISGNPIQPKMPAKLTQGYPSAPNSIMRGSV